MNDSKKLQTLIDHFADGHRARFAGMLGLPAPTLTTWMFRDSITANGRERILNTFPQVSRQWLADGTGPMLAQQPDVVHMPRRQAIPYFADVTATCGTGEQPFAPEWATDNIYLPGVDGTAALPAEGDSMTPTIEDGDTVVVGQPVTLADTRQGHIYLICTREGQRMFKRIEQPSPSSRYIMAVSDNPDYTPRAAQVDKRDILRIYPALRVIRTLG